jgi:hypothetical protein
MWNVHLVETVEIVGHVVTVATALVETVDQDLRRTTEEG